MDKYRIKEVKYDDGSILFFAQHHVTSILTNRYENIGNQGGHYEIKTAEIEIENHKRFHYPPKPIESKIHKVSWKK